MAETCAVRGAHTDHEHALGAEVHRGAHRRHLPHRSITEVLRPELHGRKEKRHGEAPHEVRQCELRPPTFTMRSRPFRNFRAAVEEGDRMGGRVTRRAQRDSVDPAGGNAVADGVELDIARQQFRQRAVVENRSRGCREGPSRKERRQPAQAGGQHVPRGDAKHLVAAKTRPDVLERSHGAAPAPGLGGERRGCDRPRGRAYQHRKRNPAPRQHFGKRAQDAHLIGRAGSAPCQDEPVERTPDDGRFLTHQVRILAQKRWLVESTSSRPRCRSS